MLLKIKMESACGSAIDVATKLSADKYGLPVDSRTLRRWSDSLSVAARQIEELARFAEAQGQ